MVDAASNTVPCPMQAKQQDSAAAGAVVDAAVALVTVGLLWITLGAFQLSMLC